MGITTYERPREKLYQKGVSVLSNAELLQVVIGSGSAGQPVAKIARKVDKILKAKGLLVTMNDLTAVQGLGKVKAGQILAGLELTNRLAYQASEQPPEAVNILADLYAEIRTSQKQTLLYAFFDGSGRLIDDHSEAVNSKTDTPRVARKLFGKALSQSTASVLVAVGAKNQALEPGMFELSLARDVYNTAALLSIQVKSFVLVSASGEYVIKEASHG